MADISGIFTSNSELIIDFFREREAGFVIPLYQRAYSWDIENIDQLMDDICQGVRCLLEDKHDIHFMGTIIKVTGVQEDLDNTKHLIPTRADSIIDGQQRISTLALLAAVLYQRLHSFSRVFASKDALHELQDVIDYRQSELETLFAVDMRSGIPKNKPKIIRESSDVWTRNDSDKSYQSDVANYVAKVIRAIHDKNYDFPKMSKIQGKLVKRNLRTINQWIEKIHDAHQIDNIGDFPNASQIIGAISEKHIWIDERPALRQLEQHANGSSAEDYSLICSFVQIQAFCHYLLNHCCFTTIKPRNEEWAYDLFQSLNATGTPLTAMETFKPTVVNLINQTDEHTNYEYSTEKKYFNDIADALEKGKTATQKSKLTDDLLTVFAHAYNGDQVQRRLSKQRLWLDKQYKDCEPVRERQLFVKYISQVAIFLKRLNEFNPTKMSYLDGLPAEIPEDDRKLATFCLLYLKDANHKMARTVLSLFYPRVLERKQNSGSEFVEATKAVTAFFTLWRSAASTSGLDDTYRKVLRGDEAAAIPAMAWARDKSAHNLSAANLKKYLQILLNEKVGPRDQWMKSAATHLNYDNVRTVCRFALFITSKDIVADRTAQGLMREKQRRELIEKNYWVPVLWHDKDKSLTIEHIAPQQRDSDSEWDSKLYEEESYHRLGNLTLMPADVNISASNRNWPAKWLYYCHLAERDEENLKTLRRMAKKQGVTLHENTLQLLKKARVNDHMESILQVGIEECTWDNSLVQDRTKRLCEILWKRLYAWLE